MASSTYRQGPPPPLGHASASTTSRYGNGASSSISRPRDSLDRARPSTSRPQGQEAYGTRNAYHPSDEPRRSHGGSGSHDPYRRPDHTHDHRPDRRDSGSARPRETDWSRTDGGRERDDRTQWAQGGRTGSTAPNGGGASSSAHRAVTLDPRRSSASSPGDRHGGRDRDRDWDPDRERAAERNRDGDRGRDRDRDRGRDEYWDSSTARPREQATHRSDGRHSSHSPTFSSHAQTLAAPHHSRPHPHPSSSSHSYSHSHAQPHHHSDPHGYSRPKIYAGNQSYNQPYSNGHNHRSPPLPAPAPGSSGLHSHRSSLAERGSSCTSYSYSHGKGHGHRYSNGSVNGHYGSGGGGGGSSGPVEEWDAPPSRGPGASHGSGHGLGISTGGGTYVRDVELDYGGGEGRPSSPLPPLSKAPAHADGSRLSSPRKQQQQHQPQQHPQQQRSTAEPVRDRRKSIDRDRARNADDDDGRGSIKRKRSRSPDAHQRTGGDSGSARFGVDGNSTRQMQTSDSIQSARERPSKPEEPRTEDAHREKEVRQAKVDTQAPAERHSAAAKNDADGTGTSGERDGKSELSASVASNSNSDSSKSTERTTRTSASAESVPSTTITSASSSLHLDAAPAEEPQKAASKDAATKEKAAPAPAVVEVPAKETDGSKSAEVAAIERPEKASKPARKEAEKSEPPKAASKHEADAKRKSPEGAAAAKRKDAKDGTAGKDAKEGKSSKPTVLITRKEAQRQLEEVTILLQVSGRRLFRTPAASRTPLFVRALTQRSHADSRLSIDCRSSLPTCPSRRVLLQASGPRDPARRRGSESSVRLLLERAKILSSVKRARS